MTLGLLPVAAFRDDPRPLPLPVAARGLLRLAAIAIPVSLALNLSVGFRLTLGTLVLVVTAPLWGPRIAETSWGSAFLVAVAGFVIGGVVLGWSASADHEVSAGAGTAAALVVVTGLLGVGGMYWATTEVGVSWVILLFGSGRLAYAVMHPGTWASNPWKYAFFFPVMLIVLTLVDRSPALLPKLAALAALGVLNVLWDTRSTLGVCVVAALVLMLQRARLRPGRWSVRTRLALLCAGAAGTVYGLTRLLVSGVLGAGVTTRSRAQLASGGNLILGGRPEWTVTLRLVREQPFGFGFGTMPSSRDYELARRGFASVHLQSQLGYIKNYMFAGGFRLHSIVADLWALGGVPGALLGAVLLVTVVTGMIRDVNRRIATSATLFLGLLAAWDLWFGPTYTNLPDVVLATSVAISGLTRPRALPALRGSAGPPVTATDRRAP
jgi:hypothetical protein